MKYSNEKNYNLLLECGAVKEGHFILASGKHSPNYIQCALFMQYPEKLAALIQDSIDELPVDSNLIFAPAVGGIPLGVMLGYMLKKKSIFAERDSNNKMILKRGFDINQNDKIIICEDVMTTGGTVLELIEIAKNAGAEIAGIFTLINRMKSNVFAGYKIFSALEIDLPVYDKDECPLCKQNIPAVRPGTKKVVF